jgi:hypothetical protein
VRAKTALGILVLAATLLAAGLAGAQTAGRGLPMSGRRLQGLTISGGRLYKAGQRFVIRGFSMESAVVPQWCSAYRWGVTARRHYGARELHTYIHRWHANTIRLQVSQEGLGDAARHPARQISSYLAEIKNQVAIARRAGLVVILAMQDQWPRSCGAEYALPTAQTVRAWKKLAARFSRDPDVIFELYNEPQAGGSDAQWKQWAYGGSSPLRNAGRTKRPTRAVGEETLVHDLRGWGADNVILVDGGNWAENLNGTKSYPITNVGSGRGVGYAVHPYRFNKYGGESADRAEWQSAYGFVADAGRLVVVTEWSYSAHRCRSSAPAVAPAFLSFLEAHGIGMTAYAGDVMHHTMANWNFNPTACGGPHIGGSGRQTMNWFARLARRG